MKSIPFHCLHAGLLAAVLAVRAPAQDITFSGGGSVSFGRIMQSSDSSGFNYNDNFIRSVGAQFLMKARYNENLQLSAGMGVVERHFLAGKINNNNGGRIPYVMSPYMVDGSFTYSFWDGESAKLKLTGGYFPYTYNPDIRNLGLYLLRGPVYPGILISGFETKHVSPVANNLGFRVQHVSGIFEQNLILNSETELYPLFDISPAYIASLQFGKAFRFGAGVNFYHLIPIESKITSPDTFAFDQSDFLNFNGDPNSRTWIYVDTLKRDTTFLSFQGTKVMAFASLDPKEFFGRGPLGPEDLRLYGEIGLIGLDNSPAYKAIYGDYGRRMPVMMGFNFPVFKALDRLALEVEWYGAKFHDNLSRYQATTSNYMSPLPAVNAAHLNLARDDWKWSLYGARKMGNVRLVLQAANDHSRPGGLLTSPANEWQSFFAAPSDWYWMTKVAYFF